MSKSIDQQLFEAKCMIEGALASQVIIKKMAPLGYDRKEILQGKAFYHNALVQQNIRVGGNGSQKAATYQMNNAFEEANKMYMQHVKTARLAIPEEDIKNWNNLRLKGARKKSKAGWMAQAQAFYQNVEPAKELLAKYGISGEELAQAQAMIEAVAGGVVDSNDKRSHVQQAREQRDIALEELRTWLSKFVKAARYAFDDNKQQLEALGIVMPS